MGDSPSPEAIRIKDVTFEIENGKSLLFSTDISIPSGSFIIVIGKVASGKSVLLRPPIGKTSLTISSIKPAASGIAFCD